MENQKYACVFLKSFDKVINENMGLFKKLMSILTPVKKSPQDEAQALAIEILNRIGEVVVEHDIEIVKKSFSLLQSALESDKEK